MPITLTPSQTKALDDTRHLAIIANAGSGKTRVLVHRYLKILEDHPKLTPRNIIAITFTDLAAAELKSRITAEVDARIIETENVGDLNRLERLTTIRNGLTGAYISTIHSFAARLLRAYPVEAHVDATFGTLVESDKDLVVEETMQRVFETELARAYEMDAAHDPLLQVFRQIGRSEMANIMNALLAARAQSKDLLKYFEENDDATILFHWKTEVAAFFQTMVDAQMPRLFRVLELSNVRGAGYENLKDALSTYQPNFDLLQTLPSYERILKAAMTKDGCGAIRDKLIKTKDRSQEACKLSDEIASTQSRYSKLLKEFGDEEQFKRTHLAYLAMLRPILRLYSLFAQAYIEIKIKYSVLDFDDQIEYLKKLVQKSELADELAVAFPYILIDEYQDTDPTQFQIAQALTRNFSPETKLSIVGDPKQSIYSFRNADLKTFEHAVECIRAQELSPMATMESYGLTHDEEQGVITLAESFRMADAPLAFVNIAFRFIFSEAASERAPEGYAELIAARTPAARGSVGWLIHWEPKDGTVPDHSDDEDETDDTDEESGGQYLDPEYALIASKIREIITIDPDSYQVDRATPAESRQPTYRDIVVLPRTRKSLPDLERAFVHYKIPYSVARGVGYFDQQEVIDLVSYLNFLVRPNDDVALFGILRSPIFALSDTFFFRLYLNFEENRSSTASTLWLRLQEACSRPELASEALLHAVEQLRENLALAGRLPASSILEKILNESAVAGTYRSMPNGAQRAANVHKLIGLVRTFDSRGFSTLYDTVSRLTDKINRNDRESQASVSDENSVKIMTVHGAKGLEFPIVFVPRLAEKSGGQRGVMIHPTKGIRANSKEAERPLITTLLCQEREEAGVQEEQRVLYVACTRARDHLFLSAKLAGGAIPKKSALEHFDPTTRQRLLNIGSDGYQIQESIQRYDAERERSVSAEITLDIPIMRHPITSANELTGNDDSEQVLPKFQLERYEPAVGLGRFSPSQLLTFEECPTKYYLRYILGLPEEARLAYDMEPSELAETVHGGPAESDGKVHGALVGQLIHKLLERVDQLASGNKLDMRAFEHHFIRIAGSLGIRQTEETQYRERAQEDLEHFIGHEIHTLVSGASRSHTEYMVQTSLSSTDLLRGIIDRLFVSADGEIQILDYKTDQTTGEQNPAKQARYAFQVKFYAYLVSLLFPKKEQIHATLFYTRFGTTERYSFDRASFSGIEQTLTQMIRKARDLERVTELTLIDRNLSHCNECAYFNEAAKKCSVLVAAEAA